MVILTQDTKEGAEFSGRPKVVSEGRVYAFSGGCFSEPGWPKKNVHTDLEFAKNCGLPTRVVSATQYMGYLVELMLHLFGESWLNHEKLNLKFIAPVDVGDRLTPKAVVRSREIEGCCVKFHLDVWCENQHGSKVAIGTASGLV